MPRPQIIRNDTLDLQSRTAASAQNHDDDRRGYATNVNDDFGPSQAAAIKNVIDEQAQAQHNPVNGDTNIDVDMAAMQVNESAGLTGGGGGGGGGGPGDLIRAGREDQAAAAESDDQFDERVSSSPSIADEEDIDFAFVYALHNFVATVEGQANATKGETMVLLDDSNSYWWLVKVLKTEMIGYLPAEHIETPTERLARLNKHRNVDLSAAMLHDVPAKTQNPLRSALNRRRAKSVAFAPVQYFEYYVESEGSDEEGEGESPVDESEEADQSTAQNTESTTESGTSTSSPSSTPLAGSQPIQLTQSNSSLKPAEDDPVEVRGRKNSSSSLKDIDSALNSDQSETVKITLTPRVAQDDSSLSSTPISVLPKEKSRIGSERDRLQKIREDLASPPPGKGGKSKKGSSVLGGFFKKRSKKGRKDDEYDDIAVLAEKDSMEITRDSQDSSDTRQSPQTPQMQPKAEPRKLEARVEPARILSEKVRLEPRLGSPAALAASRSSTIRKVEPESPERQRAATASSERVVSPMDSGPNILTYPQQTSVQVSEPDISAVPIRESPKLSPSPMAKQSIALDTGFKPQPVTDKFISPSGSSMTSFENAFSESPDPLTPVEEDAQSEFQHNGDREDGSASPLEHASPTSSNPELESLVGGVEVPPTPTALWSDASLKVFFDDEQDVHNLLVVVQDNSDIPTPTNHPDINPLFAESHSKLQDLTSRLDGLLGNYLRTRSRT